MQWWNAAQTSRVASGTSLGLALSMVTIARAEVCAPRQEDMVTVIVDMDASQDGCQSTIRIPPGTTVVEDVAVYVIDPTQSHEVWSMGYLGGIDRGLAFGHTPTNLHRGTVSDLVGTPQVPVNPQNAGFVDVSPTIQKGFLGPEVQYLEFGAPGPAPIEAAPAGPIFTVDIHLANAKDQDVYTFYLLDLVTVWMGGTGGVFSTQGAMTLDTGGDAIADETTALDGIDPDEGIPVPPAAFLVDYVDGPIGGGPATIEVKGGVPTVSRSWSALKSRFDS
jgi:hypothetical protein